MGRRRLTTRLLTLALLAACGPDTVGTVGDAAVSRDLVPSRCRADGDCAGRVCDVATGRCQPCLPMRDTCAAGNRCVSMGDGYVCAAGCKTTADCAPDLGGLGVASACCDGACVDLDASAQHCGACGKACGAGLLCCNAACVDPLGSVSNCGGCGAICQLAGATAGCVAGQCTVAGCDAGKLDCDGKPATGCEIDGRADPLHCGACDTACDTPHAVAACVAGSCAIGACATGYANCDHQVANGCEIDLTSSNASCGSCGNACGAVAHGATTCVKGKCLVTMCSGTFHDCDGDPTNGCESDVTLDAKNCAACGAACASGACGASIVAAMDLFPVGWQVNGSAIYDGGSQSGVLTPASGGAGSMIYSHPVATDRFTLSFEFQIGGGSGADGMGFLLTSDGATALGNGGGGLGMGGLNGWGVELDTYENDTCLDGNNNHVGIDALAGCAAGTPNTLAVNGSLPFALRSSGWHGCTVECVDGSFTVKLDGTPVISAFTVPGWQNGKPLWYGFSASTGGATDRHEVRQVRIDFPTPRCL